MNSQQVTAIALRIISIWLLIEVVLNLPSIFLAYSSIEQYQRKEMPLVCRSVNSLTHIGYNEAIGSAKIGSHCAQASSPV